MMKLAIKKLVIVSLLIVAVNNSIKSVFAMSVGLASPTAMIHIKASDGTVSDAPLKLNSGVNLGTPEAGAMEYDGTKLYQTINGNLRKTIFFSDGDSSNLTNLDADNISAGTLASARGGTGISNVGSLTYGANNLSFTTSGPSSITLTTTGLLMTTVATETLTNKTLTSPTINTATINTGAFSGATIYNDIGDSLDFRAEGDTDANLLFLDGSADRIGIGTNTPGAKLEVNGQVKITGGAPSEGKILTSDATGLASWEFLTGSGDFSTSSNLTSYGGTATNDFVFGSDSMDDDTDASHDARFFFNKTNGFFHAGTSTGTEADDASNGIRTVTGGYNTRSAPNQSFVVGYENVTTGSSGTDLMAGYSNSVTAARCIAMGNDNSVAGNYSIAFGNQNTSGGLGSTSFVAGTTSTATDSRSTSFGLDNNSTVNQSFIAGGRDNTADGEAALVIGRDARASAYGALAMGRYVEANFDPNITIGRGISNASRLINNSVRTLMIGFNSDVPTFYLDDAGGGAGSYSKVGIGTTSPARILHIKDVLRLEPRASAPTTPGNGDIYIDSSGSQALCAYVNGSWQVVAGAGTCA